MPVTKKTKVSQHAHSHEGVGAAPPGPAGPGGADDRLAGVASHAHLSDDLVDELLGAYERPEDLTGQGGCWRSSPSGWWSER